MKTDELTRALDRLTEIVTRMTPPIPAIPAIQAIPAIAPLPSYTGDHDLIGEINTRLKGVEASVDKLVIREDTHVTKENLSASIVESGKVHDDHEKRLKSLETVTTKIWAYGTAMVFVVGVIEVVILKLWK